LGGERNGRILGSPRPVAPLVLDGQDARAAHVQRGETFGVSGLGLALAGVEVGLDRAPRLRLSVMTWPHGPRPLTALGSGSWFGPAYLWLYWALPMYETIEQVYFNVLSYSKSRPTVIVALLGLFWSYLLKFSE
jgi:hypothetical protein